MWSGPAKGPKGAFSPIFLLSPRPIRYQHIQNRHYAFKIFTSYSEVQNLDRPSHVLDY